MTLTPTPECPPRPGHNFNPPLFYGESRRGYAHWRSGHPAGRAGWSSQLLVQAWCSPHLCDHLVSAPADLSARYICLSARLSSKQINLLGGIPQEENSPLLLPPNGLWEAGQVGSHRLQPPCPATPSQSFRASDSLAEVPDSTGPSHPRPTPMF